MYIFFLQIKYYEEQYMRIYLVRFSSQFIVVFTISTADYSFRLLVPISTVRKIHFFLEKLTNHR